MENFSHPSRLEHWQGDGSGWMNGAPSSDGSCLVITNGSARNSLIIRNIEAAVKLRDWLTLQINGENVGVV